MTAEIDHQLAFVTRTHENRIGLKAIFRQRLADLHGQLQLMGPKISKKKSAALTSVVDAEKQISNFVDEVFDEIERVE